MMEALTDDDPTTHPNILSFSPTFGDEDDSWLSNVSALPPARHSEKHKSPRAQVTVNEREIHLGDDTTTSSSSSSSSTSLRRRTNGGNNMASESYLNTSTPFIDKLYEDLKTWYPTIPIKSRDLLYYNMIFTPFAMEEVIVKSSTLSLFSESSETFTRIVSCYILPNNHLYYQIFNQNWDSNEILAQYNTGDDHGLLVIPKTIIDEIVEDVWIYLQKTGKVSIIS